MDNSDRKDSESAHGERIRKMMRNIRQRMGVMAARLSAEHPQFVDSYKFAYYMESAGVAFDGLYERFSAPLVVGPKGLQASADHPVVIVGSDIKKGRAVKNFYVSKFEPSKTVHGEHETNTYQVQKFADSDRFIYGLIDQRRGELLQIPIQNGVLDAGSEIFTLSHIDRLGALNSTFLETPADIHVVAGISEEITEVLGAIQRIHG